MRPALRKPQLDALAAIASHITAKRQRRLLTVLPTGVGKTVTFAQAAWWLRRFAGVRTRKILALAHRKELLRQAAQTFVRCNAKARVGIHEASQRCAAADFDVIVASVQSIARKQHLAAFDAGDFDMLIIDEAHHATEHSGYADVVRYFGGFGATGPLVLGWTATPNRGDGRSLGALFEDVAYSLTLEYCITTGYLVPAFLRPVPIDADLLTLGRGKRQEFNESQLASLMDNPAVTFAVLTRYEQEAQAWLLKTGRRHKTIAFAVTREHAQHVAAACREMGISAAYLGGDLPRDERQQTLADFAAGRFEVLVSVNLLLEGFDQPDITCAIDLKPTRSLVLATQEFGRILRLAPGKECAVYLQAVPAHAEAAGMIRVQDLFGLQTDDSPLARDVIGRVPIHRMAAELAHLVEAR
ncbi:MAG: DEAD/DEAH box helicase, partial [Gemmatimonadaceae bacterium]|nr:DEAD/DEAH box helicase [Gemmatimonadaceae bacterium]